MPHNTDDAMKSIVPGGSAWILFTSFWQKVTWLWSEHGVILIHFKPGKLITQGPFALCRNPIYSSIIVFIIPSLALIFHSGLIFSISLVLYLGFKISIHGETSLLRRTFGEEYEIYEKSVNEIIPFPRYLFRGKSIE
jgi:protein-S-isoprenylcysteine O-methyltransferase Ste14